MNAGAASKPAAFNTPRAPGGEIPFTKMHGLRNDFIVVDAVADAALAERSDWIDHVPTMCDRRTGIGADGVLIVSRKRDGGRNDFLMRVINADGSEPEMCGNGLRCVARMVVERGYAKPGAALCVETAGTTRTATASGDGGAWSVTVDVGQPQFGPAAVAGDQNLLRPIAPHEHELALQHGKVSAVLVSTGNPHAVVFSQKPLREWSDDALAAMGHEVEHHAAFARGINLQVVHVLGDADIEARTWERGCGVTQACGSGACAAAVAAALLGRTDREVSVHMRGGDLHIRWDESSGHMHMTGPAERVFEGSWRMEYHRHACR